MPKKFSFSRCAVSALCCLFASEVAAQDAVGQRRDEQMIEEVAVASAPTAAVATGGRDFVEINLPSALSMIGGQHPVVGFAQWRVQEAFAELQRAKVLWLPSIRAGMSYHRHDGNYQASNGQIVDVNRSSLQYGLGVAATGAGTTPRPGVVARFHLADAIFAPKIAQRRMWSQSHAAGAALNRQLVDVAVAYTELTGAHQRRSVLEQSYRRTSELAKLTRDFAEAGRGLQADADRLQTELMLVENRMVAAGERVSVASARLAESLNADPCQEFFPLDASVVPIEMVAAAAERNSLIRTGLSNRPELKQASALVAAACEQHKRQRYAPFVPSVVLGFSTGGFGGGLGNTIDDVSGRYDFDAAVSWELRNMGLGERAARRQANARVQQSKYEKIRVMDQVAREVSETYAQTSFRRDQIRITRATIEAAENSYQRNLSRIRDGQGLPLEVLQSVRALEEAKLAYVAALIDHNTAQFRLHWATGFAVTAQ